MKTTSCALFFFLMLTFAAHAQEIGVAAGTPTSGMFTPDAIEWKPGPGSLAPGAKMAVLEGDPTKDGFFTMRLWLPDGFTIAPHWHPKMEHVTVISGTFQLGMGETVDPAAYKSFPAGSFAFMSPGMRHFARAQGDTVIQVHSVGPWAINYVNEADDPRRKTATKK